MPEDELTARLVKLTKPRVFVSHSSQDKEFAHRLSSDLLHSGFEVWYDEWEIAVGDSIVDKIFDGLSASDTLVIILSPNSVTSRWVKEELNTAVMRRISESDIRILPVLVETCRVPMPLRHIRYADFRSHYDEALDTLLDSLAPGRLMWQSLSHLYDHFCLLCDQVAVSDLNSDARDTLIKIYSLLESALDLRTDIELRKARKIMADLKFFEKIGLLAEKGVDVRSNTWNVVVRFRAFITHSMGGTRLITMNVFAQMLDERYATNDLRKSLELGMERLKAIMHLICFEQWGNDEKKSISHNL